MKHTKWYNPVMKLPKKVYLVAGIFIFAAGGATVLALQPEQPVKDKETVQLATTVTEPKVTPPITVETVEQPVAQTQVENEPEPEPTPQTQNPYLEGSHLWYAFKRRAEIGRALPTTLGGNGGTWDDKAFSLGMTVDHSPEVGAVVVLNSSRLDSGVGIVDTINQDGTVVVSHMTDKTLTLTVEKAAAVFYIH